MAVSTEEGFVCLFTITKEGLEYLKVLDKQVMSVTLLRYNDVASRLLVVQLLSLACSQHPLVCALAVHASLADSMGGWRHTRATPALSWSCTLLAQAKDLLDSEGVSSDFIHPEDGDSGVRELLFQSIVALLFQSILATTSCYSPI